MGRGDKAYVLGDLGGLRDWRVFREATPLLRSDDQGNARLRGALTSAPPSTPVRAAARASADGKSALAVPATFELLSVKRGGRRRRPPGAGAAARLRNYAPHAPAVPIAGQIVSVYGEALIAGQNQIVVDQPRRARRHRARPRAGAVARRREVDRPHRRQAGARSSCPTSATACCSCSASSTACRTR